MDTSHSIPWLAAAIFVTLLGACVQATPIPVTAAVKGGDGVSFTTNPGVLKIQVFSDRVVRVIYSPKDTIPALQSFAVITKPDAAAKWDYQTTAEYATISTKLFHTRVNLATGEVGFFDLQNHPIVIEQTGGGKSVANSVQQIFRINSDEAIYGLGQHQNGLLNYHGTRVHLQQVNTDVAVPMLLSSRGYGILWNNASITDVDVAPPGHNNRLAWTSEGGSAIDYFFIAGPELDDCLAAYRDLTGPAPLLGRWAYGFWQCKERYKTQDELLAVVAEYRKRGIPLDGIIQDWQYWLPNQWGSGHFDPGRYPDPAAMIKQLHDEHCHVLISVWPKFDPGTDNLNELETAGVAYDKSTPPTKQVWYDAFSAAGRQIYWQQMSRELFSLGVDGWWLDASEPELSGNWGEFRDFQTAAGPGSLVFNAYPLMHTQGVYEGQRSETDRKRVMILTRSAYLGQQRNAAITWSGDIHGDWETFRRQIPAGLNFCASGIPYWNTDIGGFFSGRPDDPNYAELFTRWFQFGAFCPMFRVHGTNNPKEMWRFDESTQKTLIKFDELRYRLMPYIYSVAWRVTHEGYTMMRPLVMDFRTDPLVLNVTDEFMFGPSLLVCPVVQAKATAREVYLPAGTAWYDYWTGKKFDGGQTIDAPAPIDSMPIYVRAGAIMPMARVTHYSGEDSDYLLELHVYPGADGQFTLYEDEGDSYDYEKGAYSTIPLVYSDSKRELTIGARKGQFSGMLNQRSFLVSRHTTQYSGQTVLIGL